MWSYRPLIFAGAIVAALAGCGFEPLYGSHEGRVVREDLSQVRIGLIENREGQILRNELTTLMHPTGPAPAQPYELTVRLTASKQSLAVSKTKFSTRYNYVLTAAYVLSDQANALRPFSDSSTLTGSYDVVRSDFATVANESDVRDRLLREMARVIATRISAHFRQLRENGPQAS